MKLVHDVTFDSLTAVRQEIDEWMGSASPYTQLRDTHSPSRDLLVSVLIHHLADELSDVQTRSHIHALLASFTRSIENKSADRHVTSAR
jgi:hypothetical protein